MLSDTGRVKVLYIGGLPRSGTTILTRAVAELPGFVTAGELRIFWEYSVCKNYPCGCGLAFCECPFWRDVMNRAFGGVHQVDAQWMVDQQPRAWHWPWILVPGNDRRVAKTFEHYLDNLDKLYAAISDASGCRVIIDASKAPRYGLMLSLIPTIDLYVAHITRDPRAVQYSMMKRRRGNVKHSIVTSSLRWNVTNALLEVLGRRVPHRYLRMRYEDFVADPSDSLRRLAALVGEDQTVLPEIDDGRINLNPTHAALGGSALLLSGPVEIRLDSVWEQKMEPSLQRRIALATYPLLRRYGYA